MFEAFSAAFGSPRPGTVGDVSRLQDEAAPEVRAFLQQVGGGVFADGLLSLFSVREQTDLAGWRTPLPAGSQLIGCSAFGLLITTTGDDVWLTDTQYAEVVESDMSFARFLEVLASPHSRETVLREPLFLESAQRVGALLADQVYCPTPVLAQGGQWSAESLAAMSLPVYLALTSTLVAGDGVSVHRAG